MFPLVLALVVLLSVGVVPVKSQTKIPEPKPNEVILFEDKNFERSNRVYALPPGRRFTVINSLGSFDNKTSSIKIGGFVSVVVFEDSNLRNIYRTFNVDVPRLSKLRRANDTWNDSISSLMVIWDHPSWRDWKEYCVFLSGSGKKFLGPGTLFWRFFPVPEDKSADTAKYPWVGGELNDKAKTVTLGAQVKEVTLYVHDNYGGDPLYLPGPKKTYNLSSYKWGGKVSSLIVKSVPPKPTPQPQPPLVHRAPPAPEPPKPPVTIKPAIPDWTHILQVSGTWRSSKTRKIFQISQAGTNLDLLHGGDKIGSGNIAISPPSSFTLHLRIYKGPHQGQAITGKPTQVKSNIATQILWQPGGVIWNRVGN